MLADSEFQSLWCEALVFINVSHILIVPALREAKLHKSSIILLKYGANLLNNM